MLERQSLHIADLTKFGMQRVAQMKLLDDSTTIKTTFALPEAKNWCVVLSMQLCSAMWSSALDRQRTLC